METTLKVASYIQNATIGFVNQNNNIKNAVNALKSLTHQPRYTIPNTTKMGSQEEYFGISDDDRKTISDFIKFLEKKEMPMREVFDFIVITASEE